MLAIKCYISTVNVIKIRDTIRTGVKIKMRVLKLLHVCLKFYSSLYDAVTG